MQADVLNDWNEELEFMLEADQPADVAQTERRQARIASQAPVVKRAQTVWENKSLLQEASIDDRIFALAKMFKGMNRLQSIDVRSPTFTGYPGLDAFWSFDVDKAALSSNTCNFPSSK
ncbi:hypothetical protein GGR57DRAFT_499150 [Xylariaceae sp. FL1272]|nr:hypothetical protein GGR57DRAFT_499150 [Xylariaceae sp. FL1272]